MTREHLRAQATPPDLRKVLRGHARPRARHRAFSATPLDAPGGPRMMLGGAAVTTSSRITVLT